MGNRIKGHRYVDYTGRVYGLLTVEQFVGWKGNRQLYVCKDIFGERQILSSAHFCKEGFGGFLRSKESIRKRKLLANVYFNMIYRCYDLQDPAYKHYGERGITVCEEWQGPKGCHAFIIWSITKADWKEGLWLDRTDNEQGYNPENCRFITPAENNQNRRSTKLNKEIVDSIRTEFKTTILNKTDFCKLKAEDLNVSADHLANILRNSTWR